MNNYQQLFLALGIADIQAFLTFINATSKTGPNFKAAAQGAITALGQLGIAAENPGA